MASYTFCVPTNTLMKMHYFKIEVIAGFIILLFIYFKILVQYRGT